MRRSGAKSRPSRPPDRGSGNRRPREANSAGEGHRRSMRVQLHSQRRARHFPSRRRRTIFTESTARGAAAFAGVIQLVECQLPKLDVAGSSPVARSSRTRCASSNCEARIHDVGPGFSQRVVRRRDTVR
jgi:hypothetical protein